MKFPELNLWSFSSSTVLAPRSRMSSILFLSSPDVFLVFSNTDLHCTADWFSKITTTRIANYMFYESARETGFVHNVPFVFTDTFVGKLFYLHFIHGDVLN